MPIVFPLVMAFGGFLGLTGVPLPGIEIGIALSAVVLGLMVASAARPPLWVAAVLVGGFAIFHGHAHGTELPGAADPLAYSLGFVLATGLMHAGGITFGLLSRWPGGSWAVRACGRPDRPGRSELPDGCGLLKPSRHAGFGLLLALPVMAWAHSPVPGLGRFYNGMLHPVLAPAALIALVALGLPLGQRGLARARRPVLPFLLAVALGWVVAGSQWPGLDVEPGLLGMGVLVPQATGAGTAAAA